MAINASSRHSWSHPSTPLWPRGCKCCGDHARCLSGPWLCSPVSSERLAQNRSPVSTGESARGRGGTVSSREPHSGLPSCHTDESTSSGQGLGLCLLTPPLSHSLVLSQQRIWEVCGWGEGRGPVVLGTSPTEVPFLCPADPSASRSCGCVLGLPPTARGLCPTPRELWEVLSRKRQPEPWRTTRSWARGCA